jgi:hypothetical protein
VVMTTNHSHFECFRIVPNINLEQGRNVTGFG